MIYKLIVNTVFLAVGYYIGKEVGRSKLPPSEGNKTGKAGQKAGEQPQSTGAGSKTNS
jgi:hypothetical protein